MMSFSLSILAVGGGAKKPRLEVKESLPHLILNFDVNKTLILHDGAAGTGLEAMLQSAVSESTWGEVNADGQWVILDGYAEGSLIPTIHSPDPNNKGLMTYSDFLEYGEYKLKEVEEFENQNKQLKKQKKELKKNFTEEGAPGYDMRPYFEKMRQKIYLTPAARERFEGTFPNLKGGHHQILPSFFNLIKYLQDQKRSFSIVFRTFGHDIENVTKEFNTFVLGKHPLHSLPKKHMAKSIKLVSETFGALERTDDQTYLHLGVIDPKKRERAIRTITGMDAINDFIRQSSLASQTLSLRDHYDYWASKAEDAAAGKLHVVNPLDAKVHSVFFDDNVERTEAHIVDVRNVTGESISFAEANGRYIWKVDPIQALMDDGYFIKALLSCEARRAKV